MLPRAFYLAVLVGAAVFGAVNVSLAQSTFFRAGPQSQFVSIGQPVTLSASLGGAPTSFQWMKNGVIVPGATGTSLTLTINGPADAGSYTLVASDRFGSEASPPASLYLSRLANFSVRALLSPAAPSVILGHVIMGRGTVALIRAIGPGLAQFGVADGLADPLLTVPSTFPALNNDDWATAANAGEIAAAGARVGAFPLAPARRDAAALASIEGRAFSAEVKSARNASGSVLLELYHADLSATNRLVNVSARARIRGRDDALAAGFVLAGEAPTTLVIRATGPSLAALGVSEALAAPTLELFRPGTSEPIARNERWGGTAEWRDRFADVGAFAFASADSKDAALLVTLDPGSYTLRVASGDGSSGEVLLEIYVRP